MINGRWFLGKERRLCRDIRKLNRLYGDMHWWHGDNDMGAAAKAVVVVARRLPIVTYRRGKHIDYKEVCASGKQQREGSEDENAMVTHRGYHRMKDV